jgi:hypothetical protein
MGNTVPLIFSFKENAVKVSNWMKHSGGIKRASELVEYAYLDGTAHLVPKGVYMPWYQQSELDVMLLLTLILVATFWISKKACLACCQRRSKKVKTH